MFQNFKTYQLAVQLYQGCEKVAARSHLKDQLLRASLSIVLNISEGSANPSIKDRKRFYGIALGSCRETQSILTLIDRKDLFSIADQVGACLYCLVHK